MPESATAAEEKRLANLLSAILLMTLASATLTLIWLLITSPQQQLHIRLNIVTIPLLMLAYLFLRRRAIAAASWLLILTLWVTTLINATYNGGARSIEFGLMTLMILMAGLLQGIMAAGFLTVMSVAAVVWFAYLEMTGQLPAPLIHHNIFFAGMLRAVGFVAAFIIFYLSTRELRNALGVARTNAKALRHANQALQHEIEERKQAEVALEQERSSLAQRVRARTAELEAANVELQRAAKMKDEFVAGVSHELRTPLNAIIGNTEMLREEMLGPLRAQQLRSLARVDSSAKHLLQLINDILDVAKVEAGGITLMRTAVDVPTLCQESLDLVRDSAVAKQIEIVQELDPRVQTIDADPLRLKQVIVNLLSNAVKFTPDNGRIGLVVQGDPLNQEVHFQIWDTGIGISQAQQSDLFTPFMQLDSRLSRDYAGTGLGLALSKRMVSLHGGRIALESEPGVGSRFTVILSWPQPTPRTAAQI